MAVFLLFGLNIALASTSNGTIDSTNKYARFSNSDLGLINFGATNGSITITDAGLSGYAWGESAGWINLNPTNGGVDNDAEGNLSGYAWGENTGWINFNPTNGGVTINSSGDFSGYAWSQNYGWIVFNCSTDSTCATYDHKVSTDWRPLSSRSSVACNNSTDDDGDGLTDYPNDTGCSSLLDTDESNPAPGAAVAIAPIVPIIPIVPVIDVCPNIGGAQTTIPSGLSLDSFGNCVAPELLNDSCPNISGNQTELPGGYILDSFGNCVLPEDPTDVCPNISGEQATIPNGYMMDGFGNCIIPEDEYDVCPNISGNQLTLPEGNVRDANGNCVYGQLPSEDNPLTNPPHVDVVVPAFVTSVTQNILPQAVAVAIEETYIAVGNVARDSAVVAKKIYDTPAGETTVKTVTTAGVVTGGAVAVSTAIFNPGSVAELALAPFRLWTLLLSFLGLRRKYKPWGTVYDSVTKQPLDPAYVVLQDENGKEITSSITDIDGRYGFLMQAGRYKIVANKTNYTFPSKRLAEKGYDSLYANLYFGETINIPDVGAVIVKSIPMDPIKFDWNEFAKKDQKLMRFYSKFDSIFAKIANILFVTGFVIAIIALFIAPQPYNIITFALYVALLILRIVGLKPKTHGYITDAITGNPLPFAIVRVVSAELNTEIAHKVSDVGGRYFCLVPNGKYYLKIEKKISETEYEHVYTTKVFDVKKGIINSKIEIEK